jgi:hypothetical protein
LKEKKIGSKSSSGGVTRADIKSLGKSSVMILHSEVYIYT